MRVPLDRSRRTSGAISLKVTRVRSSAPSRSTRTLFVNPGGPGVAADWLAPALAAHFPALHRSHVIVAVDPRGAGGSTPLDCDLVPAPIKDLRRGAAGEVGALQRATAATVRACVARHGRTLPHVNTRETVADLDAVRARLGAAQIDWYGVSAGTWLGARYAQAYPRRIGRMVLDSTVEVTATWRASFAEQPRGFQRRYSRQFLPWVARHHRSYRLGRTPAQVLASVESLRARAGAGRLGRLTPVDLDALIASRMYDDLDFFTMAGDLATLADEPSARRLAAIRKEAHEARTGQGLLTAEDTVFMAVQCNDFAWSRSASSYVAEGRALGTAFPLLGWTWLASPCATWPYRPAGLPPLARHSLPRALVLHNEVDPATPWEGARRVLRAQRNLRAVVVDDEGSHGVLLGGNACAVGRGTTYLTTGRLPTSDVVCRGRPLPGDTVLHPTGATLTPAALRR